MADPPKVPKRNGKGFSTRYCEAIYDQSKTHGSNSLANYEKKRNVGDNTEKQANETPTELQNLNSSGVEEAENRTKEMHHVHKYDSAQHDHEKSWRKYFRLFGKKAKKLSNAVAKKYIKWGKSHAMQNKYVGRISIFNAANAKPNKMKGGGDKKITLVEREWIAAQYARRFGRAPELVNEVIVLEALMKKTKCRYVGASKYFENKIVQDADQVVTLTWGSAPRMIKCVCPLNDCICLGNTLLPPDSVPRGSLLYNFPLVRQLVTWFTKREQPKGLLVPDLIKSASVEQKLYILLEEKKILQSFGPEMTLYGCRNFFYYNECSMGITRQYWLNQMRQAIIDGSEIPIRADAIIARLKEADPRIREPSKLPSTKAKSEHLERIPPLEEEPVEQLKEKEEEVNPQSDRICNYMGKCTSMTAKLLIEKEMLPFVFPSSTDNAACFLSASLMLTRFVF